MSTSISIPQTIQRSGIVATYHRDSEKSSDRHEQKWDLIRRQVVELHGATRVSLQAHLRNLGLSESDADDVVQESFLRLLRHLMAGGAERNLRAWLFQVAYRQAMNKYRFDRRFVSLVEEPDDFASRSEESAAGSQNPEEACIYNDRVRRLNVALTFLPTQQRKCVLLRSKGLRYREIATNLGVTTQRVAMLMDRGMARLAARL